MSLPDASVVLPPSAHEMNRYAEGQARRITCPYCTVGAAVVVLERSAGNGAITVQVDLKEPRKCDTCSRYFQLKPVTKLIGVPLEGDKP